MHKKGFTLAELLASITLLAIISIVTTTVVVHFLKRGKEDLYQQQLNNIKLAAKAWTTDHKDAIGVSDCYPVTLSTLQTDGYIDNNIKNPISGETLDNEKIVVSIIKNKNNFSYELSDDGKAKCSFKSYAVGDIFSIHGDSYHVIANSPINQDYVTVLKANPLTASEINANKIASDNVNHVNRYTWDYVGEAYTFNDSNKTGGLAYYTSDTCGYVILGDYNSWIESGCTTSYDSSDIKHVVDNWARTTFSDNELATDSNGYQARLITKDELVNNLGCTSNYCGNSSYDWIYNISGYWYWTMTPNNSDLALMTVHNHGYFGGGRVDNVDGELRPVINIKKSALEGGNNNE